MPRRQIIVFKGIKLSFWPKKKKSLLQQIYHHKKFFLRNIKKRESELCCHELGEKLEQLSFQPSEGYQNYTGVTVGRQHCVFLFL